MTAWDVFLNFLEKSGGIAAWSILLGIIVKFVVDISNNLIKKKQVESQIAIAKAKADEEIRIAKAKAAEELKVASAEVEKLKAEANVISAKAADFLANTMQHRLDILTTRIDTVEKENEAKDAEIVCLKARMKDLELSNEKKDAELLKRDRRIVELEKQTATQADQIASQAAEIAALTKQVAELQKVEKKKTGPLPFLAPKAGE